jgi:hypothetical protein
MADESSTRRFRWRALQLLVVVGLALAGVASIVLTEQAHRGRLAAGHARQQDLCEARVQREYLAGRRARASGRRAIAAAHFAATTYWTEQATSHERMRREFERPWWRWAR